MTTIDVAATSSPDSPTQIDVVRLAPPPTVCGSNTTFHSVGALVEGSALLATVPQIIAREILAQRPRLRTAALPFRLGATPMELLTRAAVEEDPAVRFVTEHIVRIAESVTRSR